MFSIERNFYTYDWRVSFVKNVLDILYDRNTLYRLIVQKYNMSSSQTQIHRGGRFASISRDSKRFKLWRKNLCSRNNKNAL